MKNIFKNIYFLASVGAAQVRYREDESAAQVPAAGRGAGGGRGAGPQGHPRQVSSQQIFLPSTTNILFSSRDRDVTFSRDTDLPRHVAGPKENYGHASGNSDSDNDDDDDTNDDDAQVTTCRCPRAGAGTAAGWTARPARPARTCPHPQCRTGPWRSVIMMMMIMMIILDNDAEHVVPGRWRRRTSGGQ